MTRHPIAVICPDVPNLPDYLTAGKRYKAEPYPGAQSSAFYFTSDNHHQDVGLWKNCCHLPDGADWIPVYEDEEEPSPTWDTVGPQLRDALKKIVVDEERRAKDLRHREAWLPLKFSEERMAKARTALKLAEQVK